MITKHDGPFLAGFDGKPEAPQSRAPRRGLQRGHRQVVAIVPFADAEDVDAAVTVGRGGVSRPGARRRRCSARGFSSASAS